MIGVERSELKTKVERVIGGAVEGLPHVAWAGVEKGFRDRKSRAESHVGAANRLDMEWVRQNCVNASDA